MMALGIWLLMSVVSGLLHVLVFRFFRPKRHLLWLVACFLAVFAFGLIMVWMSPQKVTWLYASLGQIVMLPAYLVFYTATVAESPSVVVMETISRAGDRGVTKDEIIRALEKAGVVADRLQGLLQGGYLERHQGHLRLTWRGRIYMEFFLLPRTLMGREHHGA